MTLFGTIISFDVRGDSAAADAVCAGLQLILPPTLLRLSVGIEAVVWNCVETV